MDHGASNHLRISAVYLIVLLALCSMSSSEAHDPLDPTGNITIKWDVMLWTGDGYVAVVTMYNYQKFRHIQAPGWTMGWSWAQREVIWAMVGGFATQQGDCSKFHGEVPHSCKRSPTVVDLPPDVPYNAQISNCCKGGVLNSWVQDPASSVAAFQVSVGMSGNTNTTVKLPKNFTLMTPGPGYTCGPANIVKPTLFSDGRRVVPSLMTWNVICTYSQFLASKTPTCCLSLSSFYNKSFVPCPTCSCACQKNDTSVRGCLQLGRGLAALSWQGPPVLRCTQDMCPIRVHWHVEENNKAYWRVKVSIFNQNYGMNYSQWNIVLRHPNLNSLVEVSNFTYKSIYNPYGNNINNTGMFWGIKHLNDVLNEVGPNGNVQSEMLFKKDVDIFSFGKGWAFPDNIYFNGDNCVTPPLDAYPPTLPK